MSIDPFSLNPTSPLLCIVGKDDNPEFTSNPLTVKEIGLDEDLEPNVNLPQENLPTGLVNEPVVANPTIDVLGSMTQVTIPSPPTLAGRAISCTE